MRFSLFSPANGRRRRVGLSLFASRSSASQRSLSPDSDTLPAPPGKQADPLALSVDDLIPTRPLSAREMLEHLQLRSRLEPPLTWVFAGDSLSCPGQVPGRGCSQGSFLAEFLRDSRRRTADTFVFAETPGLQLATIGLNEVTRIERFHPDILFLTCGTLELEQALESSLEFESMFFRLVEALRRPGRILAVNLPPCLPFLTENETKATNALIRLEALRACSLEADLLLIDHWTHWETNADVGWYSSDGRSPSARGSREMARLTVRALGLETTRNTEQTLSNQEPNSREVAHGAGHRQS